MPQRVKHPDTGQLGYLHKIGGETRFIADDPANTPSGKTQIGMPGVAGGLVGGGAEAALVGFGEMSSNAVTRFKAAADTVRGKQGTAAQQEIRDVDQLLAPLEASNPFSLALGKSIPGFLAPSSKVAQTATGVAEGMLFDPENPYLSGAIGGAGALVGGAAGQRLANMLAKRAGGALGRLASRNIPTTLYQRTGNEAEKAIESGLQAIPLISTWASKPLRAQQRALNEGVQSAFGYQGKLDAEGLGFIKAGLSRQFDEVEAAIPDMQLDAKLVARLEELDVLDDATEEFMRGYGLVDGEALMSIRSNLNNDMADAFINANRKEGRRLRTVLNEVDGLIEDSMPLAMGDQWASARNQWQFFTAITKGKAINGAGEVRLDSMVNNLRSIYPNFRVGRDLPGVAQGFGELVQALDSLPRALQSSGSAERAAATAALTGTGFIAPKALIVPGAAALRAVGQPGIDVGATVGVGLATGLRDAQSNGARPDSDRDE